MMDTVAMPAGFRIERRGTVGSTNDVARELAEAGAADGTVVWADRQTAGRGRQGRRWQSPEGNLCCSIVLRPDRPAGEAAQLSLVAGVALTEALADIMPEPASVRTKWPNDVLVEGRKVAGLLLESSGVRAGHVEWVVLGCGVNVAEAPSGLDQPVGSLHGAGARVATPSLVLDKFLAALAVWRRRWQDRGVGAIREAWLGRAHGLGDTVTVRFPDTSLTGRFVGMDSEGALLLALADGSQRVISAGDVFL